MNESEEYQQGDLLAQEAIQQAETHAAPEWLLAARRVVWQLIQLGQPFSTDDVWDRLDQLDVHTHEHRALGSVMRNASRAGLIDQTGSYFKSRRPEAHSRPIPLWLPRRQEQVA